MNYWINIINWYKSHKCKSNKSIKSNKLTRWITANLFINLRNLMES